jgi:hypothetical protein
VGCFIAAAAVAAVAVSCSSHQDVSKALKMSPKQILQELMLLAQLAKPTQAAPQVTSPPHTTPAGAGAGGAAGGGGVETAAAAGGGEGGGGGGITIDSSTSSSSSSNDGVKDLSGMDFLPAAALERSELLLNVAQYSFTKYDEVRGDVYLWGGCHGGLGCRVDIN